MTPAVASCSSAKPSRWRTSPGRSRWRESSSLAATGRSWRRIPDSRRCVRPERWDTAEIRSIPSADFLRALARGKPVYDLATLERYVDDDLALLRAVRPAVVIGDFRISLAVSARLGGVPYINITNAYWSPYARPRWHAPTMPWSRHRSRGARRLGVPSRQTARVPAACPAHASPGAKARPPHAGIELRHVYTDGDLTLYADSPALVATYDRPSTHRYLGLIDWAPSAPLPPWWDSLQAAARARSTSRSEARATSPSCRASWPAWPASAAPSSSPRPARARRRRCPPMCTWPTTCRATSWPGAAASSSAMAGVRPATRPSSPACPCSEFPTIWTRC